MRHGWQARITLAVSPAGLHVEKTYGAETNWREEDAVGHADALRTYHSWLDRNGISYAPSVLRIAKNPEEENYFVVTRQRYLGPDGADLLARRSTPSAIHKLFESLLTLAVRLGYECTQPLFRAEVKPQDFCDADGRLVMVDTCPPVFALSESGIRCGERGDTDACVMARERDEVLRVTGSANGIVTNLVEHCAAILPTYRFDFIERAIVTCDLIGDHSVAERLRSVASEQKITLLESRFRRES